MQYRKITELYKLEGNPRYIKGDDMETLKESIKSNRDYFEARPIILSNRTGKLVVIAGNQRLEAAKLLGMDEVPTYLLENLTEEREREIIIRDNVSNGNWDWEQLANQYEIGELEDWGLEMPKEMSDDDEDKKERAKFPRIVITYTDVADLEESLDYIKETAEQSNGKVTVDIPE